VTIADFSYSPARFNARAGQPVQLTVTNGGQFPHTFTITGVVDSGSMAAGTSKPVTFTPSQAGTLTYFCTIHGEARMSGQITVAGTTGSLPPDGPGGGQTTTGAATPSAGTSTEYY
jgi:plastocyanin